MISTPQSLGPAHTALAEKVMGKLAELHGELDSAMNPHRLALRHLGPSDRMGWLSAVYHDEPFRAWQKLLQSSPGDLETLHHLAIMHHARAIDLEASESPKQSDPDWEAALGYWTRLWQSDAFWDRIAALANVRDKRRVVEELRA